VLNIKHFYIRKPKTTENVKKCIKTKDKQASLRLKTQKVEDNKSEKEAKTFLVRK